MEYEQKPLPSRSHDPKYEIDLLPKMHFFFSII